MYLEWFIELSLKTAPAVEKRCQKPNINNPGLKAETWDGAFKEELETEVEDLAEWNLH